MCIISMAICFHSDWVIECANYFIKVDSALSKEVKYLLTLSSVGLSSKFDTLKHP